MRAFYQRSKHSEVGVKVPKLLKNKDLLGPRSAKKVGPMVLLLVWVSVPSMADSTDYIINFNPTVCFGSCDVTSGSFTYDSTSGFSDFFVSVYGYTFDLTTAANKSTFEPLLTGCCDPAYTFVSDLWDNNTGPLFPSIRLSGDISGMDCSGFCMTTTVEVMGTWSISAVEPVPEPSALALMFFVALAGIRRRSLFSRPARPRPC